jgi:2,3-dihydroxy-p-cumate/2,3-dihydroxybenzoate 3,4-dioxygenase
MSVDFRYARAGYVALNVTNLDAHTEFLTNIFCISPAGEGPNGERFFRSGMQHHDVVLYQNDVPGLVRHAWEMESEDDVQKAYRHFEGIGLKPTWVSKEETQALGLDFNPVFRVREPTIGVCYEFYSDMLKISAPLSIHMTEFEGFLHTGVNFPDVRASTEFAVENMGYVVSDYLGDYVGTLVRAWPIPHHHTFAFLPAPSGEAGLNHVAWKVKTIDDIGRYYHRAKNSGIGIGLGMGKHPTSGSYHAYVFDPDGMSWEYSQGMEQFPEENYRRGRYMSPAPEDFDLWGSMPQKGFGASGNIVTED